MLKLIDFSKHTIQFSPPISPNNPGDNLKLRPLNVNDYHKGKLIFQQFILSANNLGHVWCCFKKERRNPYTILVRSVILLRLDSIKLCRTLYIRKYPNSIGIFKIVMSIIYWNVFSQSQGLLNRIFMIRNKFFSNHFTNSLRKLIPHSIFLSLYS